MKSNSQKDRLSSGSGQTPGGAVWAIVVWGRVVVGLVLGAVGGVVFGHAWTQQSAPLWWVGAISLLVGVLLVLSGLYARSRPAGVTPDFLARERARSPQEPLVPLVGALLLYKYHYITQQQLDEALARQRKGQDTRRLGEILLAMDAVTRPQLDEALRYQRSVFRQKQQMAEPSDTTEDRPSGEPTSAQ